MVCSLWLWYFLIILTYFLVRSHDDTNIFGKTVKKFKFKNCQESKISCENWYSHFKRILYSENAAEFNFDENLNDNNDNQFHEYFNVPFTMSELISSVNDLNIGKASDADRILAEMIKNWTNLASSMQ